MSDFARSSDLRWRDVWGSDHPEVGDRVARDLHPDFPAYIRERVGQDAQSVIDAHEGGLRSMPYRCRHLAVTVGGEACFICGLDLSGTAWQEEWRRRGHHAPGRPLPTEHGIGAVLLRSGEGGQDE